MNPTALLLFTLFNIIQSYSFVTYMVNDYLSILITGMFEGLVWVVTTKQRRDLNDGDDDRNQA